MVSHNRKSSKRTIEEMMKDLKVDPLVQVHTKERNQSDTTSCISSAGDVTGGAVEGDAENESLETYQGLPCPFGGYYGYCYPGYDASIGELNNQVYYSDGMELQYPVIQGENGLIYFMPSIQSSLDSTGLYVPVIPVSVDGQYMSQQLHSPTLTFASPGYLPNPLGYGELMSSPYVWDASPFSGDGYGGVAEIPGSKYDVSSSHIHAPHLKNNTSIPSLNASLGNGIGNQLKSSSWSNVQGKGYFPFTSFPSYNQGKDRAVYPSGCMGKNTGAQEWIEAEKLKGSNKVNNVSDLNEKNLLSRTADVQDRLINGVNIADSLLVDGNGKSSCTVSVIRRDQYNLPDFTTKYDKAFFFVIKSYSEDDIHKSVKYSVWSSTPNGNKKLDNAYQEAQKTAAEKGGKCPVFLFFSVNASGQFCGVAEMIGSVDFEKSMDFWQQDKWTGYFPVKWHIIKDVPNPLFRHIVLEYNENKPVTNSRDTQEVRLPQGIEMLSIFKDYVSKTSVLDDFDFYESREKVMLQKKIRSPIKQLKQIKLTGTSSAKSMEPVNGNKAKE